VLLLLEHPPVYTVGGRSTRGELPMATEWYEDAGDRGARHRPRRARHYHGPGQLVAYPIVDLKPYADDVHEHVRRLEQVAIEGLAGHSVVATTIEG
jgi:lipoate-protein ligase B